ncbi:alpha/beta hydrolase [Undibacterium sp. 5I1]|uniref:RBBP9/YdeN family alpha/beta hydrolase n=1 Tax=unclassified Undibacterium TaxID=2630295 RepID=UPI002AB5892B|nr:MULTISPECIES: alpha/beta hydrolase [unclassified Undibacterium]MDY7539703.1 alpha/beta hydrolase [Undibacterium sp. 5I1]MEB0230867.1 alpha/beta hydrolase [Undibacterium sp. 10I3]MEB0257478.1 alpha/beta hydrolase [Undibacterium sp. 5I1]
MTILLLPGLHNSDDTHWQSLWEQQLAKQYDIHRVQQDSWDQPDRESWVTTLSQAVNRADGTVILVAHSLGCALVAWWVASGMPGVQDTRKVRAALLVAPPEVERVDFPAPSFAPMPQTAMRFKTKVIVSDDDPWCEMQIAQKWAQSWGAEFHHIGAKGHINGDSGLCDWKQGQHWLAELVASAEN